MDLTLFLIMLFTLQLFYLFLARYKGTRKKGEIQGMHQVKEEYFFAGRSVSFFPLMMSFLAAQVGGGLVLGACEEAYRFGWVVLCYPLGAALGLMILGMGIGRKLAQYKASTVAEVLGNVFGSSSLRAVAASLSVLSLFLILVAQVVASHKFMIALGIVHPFWFFSFWALVILYTVVGGLRGVIATDIYQSFLFCIVFCLCLGVAFFNMPALFTPSALGVSSTATLSIFSAKWSSWLLMPLLFMLIEQDMAQRCFAGGSPRTVSKAAFTSGIATMAICVIPVLFGVLAKQSALPIPEGGSVFMTFVSFATNKWIFALTGCAVLAAIISTASSLINAISSNLSHDLLPMSLQQKRPLLLIRTLTTFLAAAAFYAGLYFQNILDLLIQSYELSVSCISIATMAALFARKKNLPAVFLSVVGGALGFCLCRLYPLPFSRELLSIGLSALGYGLGLAFFTKKAQEPSFHRGK